MIYTDGSHLIADTLPELHIFAKAMGLKKQWCRPGIKESANQAHYKIWGNTRKLIMRDERVKYIFPAQMSDSTNQPFLTVKSKQNG